MNTTLPLCWSFTSFLKKGLFTGVFLILFVHFNSFGQGPGSLYVDAGPDITVDCATGTGCATITADFLQTFESASNSYTVGPITYNPPFPFNGLATQLNPNQDDRWSVVENLPFDFCYFENIETQFQVGSNGVIRFDVDPNDTTNGWSFTENLPNNSNSTLGEANVFTPGHDIDPSVSTTEEIGYEVLGTYPNRVLVVSYFEVPMFSFNCNSLLATQMVVFYEFSNVVEVYIQDKPVCPSWNSGNATLGIQNNDGNIAFVPPGRNTSDSPWTTTNEAWRFSPAGAETYVFEWIDSGGNFISNNPSIEVCPVGTEVYTARVTYTNCNGEVVVLTDDVEVTSSATFSVDLGGDQVLCDTPSYDLTATLEGIDPADVTFLWSTGETTQTITVTATDIYSVEVTGAGCTITDSVSITFLTGQQCIILSECGDVDFEENFGTGTGRVCDLNGATTTYVCNTVSQVEDGQYSITNISNGLNTGWHVNMEDHTENDVNGRMMFVNADFTVGEFYRRTITLSENIDYTFSAWITTVYDTDTGICGGNSIPSNVIFRIEDPNGALIQETNTGNIPNGSNPNWQEFFINFNTGANTNIQLVLINNSIGGCGNDLAIDDITLAFQNSQPQIIAPGDLTSCDETGTGVGTFDLDSQIPILLNGLDPLLFNTTFHLTQFQADANTNPIVNTSAYNNISNPQTIYVRVEKVSEPSCFSTVSFDLLVDELIDLQIALPTVLDLCSTDEFPVLDATPQNPNVNLNDVTYEWVDGGGNVVSTMATYTPTAAGTYTVTVTLPPCTEEIHSVEINVFETPTLDLGADEQICDGSEFEIIPTIVGDTTGITYLWSTGETTPTILVTASGDYSLEITVGPCIVTDTISISIAENPIIDLGEDFQTCFAQTLVLDASPSNYDPTLASYEWSLDGTVIAGETNPTLTISQNGDYSVIVSVFNCTAADSILITPANDIQIDLGEDFTSCFVEILTLDASPSNYDPTLASYEWSLDGTVIIGETNATLIVSQDGTYSVVVTIGNCTAQDSIVLTPANDIQIDLGEDFPSCFEQALVLDASPSNYDPTLASYEWSLDGTVIIGETNPTLTVSQNGAYSVVVSISNCSAQDSILITPANDIQIDLGADLSSCFVESLMLDASPSNYDPTLASYQWSLNGAEIAGATNATLLVSQDGNYSVVVTVGNCTAQDSILISPANDIQIDLGENFQSCFDQNILLDASPSNYNPALATYEWSLDGFVIPGETTSELFISQGGLYSVSVTINACVAEDSILVTPREALVVEVDPDFKTCPDEVQVLTAVTSETDVNYQWSLNGDLLVGATASTLEINIPANTLGEQLYTVTISVGNCSGSASVGVILYDVGNCVIPQGLSPNGDGLNDCLDLEFIVDRTGNFSVEIFNRYGMSLFEKNIYTNEFCGIDNDGNELPTGTYFYVMKFATPDPVYGSVKTGWIYINKEEN